MLLAYVAGPFTAPTREGVEANIRRAELLGVEVAKRGVCPVCPHANTAAPEYETSQPYSFWIEATLEIMRRCDVVVFTPDWTKSQGARGEFEEAARLGLPCFFSMQELDEWLEVVAK
jgi:hypothetical protein